MSREMHNVRIVQQEDKRWTVAWEDEDGKTQERTDYPNADEATRERDTLMGYLKGTPDGNA